MKITFGDVLEGRKKIVDYVYNKKIQAPYSVIDVGASATGWSINICDAIVDKNPLGKNLNIVQFNFDICEEKEWNNLLLWVAKNGKFDYSICTHTLEDVYNPYLVLKNLPKISKSGIISTPSVHTEINFIESNNWSGFLHHRYLFGFDDSFVDGKKIIIAPKLPLVEKLKNRTVIYNCEEIRYEWEDNINFEIFMDNYLGPNSDTVLKNYELFLLKNAKK